MFICTHAVGNKHTPTLARFLTISHYPSSIFHDLLPVSLSHAHVHSRTHMKNRRQVR